MASSAAEKALETYSRSILFVEELTADESESHVINDLDPEKSVAALCKSIAQAINDTASGSTMKVIFAGEVMDDGSSASFPSCFLALSLSLSLSSPSPLTARNQTPV